MTFENMDMDANLDMDEAPPPEESTNRPFFVIAGILAGFTLLALACIAVYAFYFVPQRRAQQAAQVEQLNAQNTQMAAAITQTSVAAAFTSTPTATQPTLPTSTPTVTPVVVLPSPTTVSTQDPRTATVAALLTQAASGQQTVAPRTPTPTALPVTGFADDVGLPGMLGLAALLIVVIVMSRRLRTAR
ncbi:MAG: hypothetical protein PHD58_00625 [Anaerolineales bacterium]|nr:hypothetical protein [Anaerolineales bacterium]